MFNRARFKTIGQILLSGFLVFQILFGYLTPLAQAQLNTNTPAPTQRPEYGGVQQSIEKYLCVPNESNLGTALFDCISRVYKFGVAFGAIALVFFIVYAGYMYITGGEATKEKGKSTFISALTGMAIILGSYVLLGFINPDLVRIKPIQPPIFTAANLPLCADVGLGVNCVLPDGQINVGGGGGTPGSASEAQYKALISQYAQANGMEYCALSALIEKESSFNTLNVSNPPPNKVDTSSGSPPSYNVTHSVGHGIGLGQVYIFPGNTSRDGGEFGMPGKKLTVKDLIVPETGISAGAYFFGKLVKKNNGALDKAYDDYQSGAKDTRPGYDSDPATIRKYMEIYNKCKLRG